MIDLEDLGLKAFSYTARKLLQNGYMISRRQEDEFLFISKGKFCALGSHDEDVLAQAYEHFEMGLD